MDEFINLCFTVFTLALCLEELVAVQIQPMEEVTSVGGNDVNITLQCWYTVDENNGPTQIHWNRWGEDGALVCMKTTAGEVASGNDYKGRAHLTENTSMDILDASLVLSTVRSCDIGRFCCNVRIPEDKPTQDNKCTFLNITDEITTTQTSTQTSKFSTKTYQPCMDTLPEIIQWVLPLHLAFVFGVVLMFFYKRLDTFKNCRITDMGLKHASAVCAVLILLTSMVLCLVALRSYSHAGTAGLVLGYSGTIFIIIYDACTYRRDHPMPVPHHTDNHDE